MNGEDQENPIQEDYVQNKLLPSPYEFTMSERDKSLGVVDLNISDDELVQEDGRYVWIIQNTQFHETGVQTRAFVDSIPRIRRREPWVSASLIAIPSLKIDNEVWMNDPDMPKISVHMGTLLAAENTTCSSICLEFRKSEIWKYRRFLVWLMDKMIYMLRRVETYIQMLNDIEDNNVSSLRDIVAMEGYRMYAEFLEEAGHDRTDIKSAIYTLKEAPFLFKNILEKFRGSIKAYLELLGYYSASQLDQLIHIFPHEDIFTDESRWHGKGSVTYHHRQGQLSIIPSLRPTDRPFGQEVFECRSLLRTTKYNLFDGGDHVITEPGVVTFNKQFVHEHDVDPRLNRFHVRDFSTYFLSKDRPFGDVAICVEMPAPLRYCELVDLMVQAGSVYRHGTTDYWERDARNFKPMEISRNIEAFLENYPLNMHPLFAYTFVNV